MMKLFFLIAILISGCLRLVQAQNQDSTNQVQRIDSLIKTKNASQQLQDSIEQRTKREKIEYSNAIDSLRRDINRLAEKKNKTSKEISSLSKKIKNLTVAYDSLVRLTKDQAEAFKNSVSTSKSVDSLRVIKQKVLDSINKTVLEGENNVGLLKAKEKDLQESKAKLETDNLKLLAEVAKKEDSLHVIAKIQLKTDTKGKKYKVGIHVDGLKIIKKLNDLDANKKESTSIEKRLKEDEKEKVLAVYGENGFRNFSRQKILEIIKNKQWEDSIPLDFVRKDSFQVEEVRINVFEGMIREILVKTTYGTFRNINSPIDLVHAGERFDDRLYRDGEKIYENEYLVLGEVISYIPVRTNNDLPYTQFDITLLPDSSHKNDFYWIKESTSINTYFDVAVFSDIKGLSGDANGLAQTTLSAKFITNTRNFKNKALIPLNYLSFVGGLSKFDNEFKGTKLETGDSVNRKDLLQRANYYTGLKLNLLHWILSPKPVRLIQDIQVNAGYNFTGSKLLSVYTKGTDSSSKVIYDTTYKTVTHNVFYVEPIVSLNRYRNFNMALSLPLYFVNLKESSGIANKKNEFWIKPSIELMYYSKRNSSSKIFFRYNHWINLKEKSNAFVQMQLGYSANLGELFNRD